VGQRWLGELPHCIPACTRAKLGAMTAPIMTAPIIVLWVYIVLLVAGGLVGFVKAGSKASLIASSAFALPLVLAALDIVPALVAEAVLGILLVFMGMKFAKSKKFMPSGLMAILSLVALALRFFLK